MPLQQTTGNVTTDAYGGGVAAVPNYIEDVFSTYLYTGNGSTQTITNGIDLSTKGGLTWLKARTTNTQGGSYQNSHMLFDSARGISNVLRTDGTDAQVTGTTWVSSFNSSGFTLDGTGNTNGTGVNYASWTFRKQPKFFDVVTYTGNGAQTQLINHSLGSIPGCVIIKRTDSTSDWNVSHQSAGANGVGYFGDAQLFLNTTAAINTNSATFFCDRATSTTFRAYLAPSSSVGGNISGATYVAYLFAHNAGGFGLTGTDNVISCGSFAGNVGAYVNLGYEPQWILCKRTDGAGNWFIADIMRGFPAEDNFSGPTNSSAYLQPNTSNAEATGLTVFTNATGFYPYGLGVTNYIYIAIRRGPMKVPTSGTSVYATDTLGGSSGGTAVPAYRSPFPVDWAFEKRTNAADNWIVNDRLRGINSLNFNLTAAEALYDSQYKMDFMNGWVNYTGSNSQYRSWMFRRSPSFFDEVCYTGTGAVRTINHNLGVAPEMMIVKSRDQTGYSWATYSSALGNTQIVYVNSTGASFANSNFWANTTPTSSVFTVGSNANVNGSGATYVAYLFATCAGVSKVGSYTGNGSSQTINCGFTGGARFVLIKCTSTTGNWYVYDTARGMTTLTDPYLLLNSTAAESATLGSVTTVSTGFAVNASILAAINTNAASYIFLAIA